MESSKKTKLRNSQTSAKHSSKKSTESSKMEEVQKSQPIEENSSKATSAVLQRIECLRPHSKLSKKRSRSLDPVTQTNSVAGPSADVSTNNENERAVVKRSRSLMAVRKLQASS